MSKKAMCETEISTIPYIVEKISDIVGQHEGSVLIFTSGIVTSIIIYVISKSISEIIKASHNA